MTLCITKYSFKSNGIAKCKLPFLHNTWQTKVSKEMTENMTIRKPFQAVIDLMKVIDLIEITK